MALIDITVALHDGLAHWPGSCGFTRTLVSDMAQGANCNGSETRFDLHVGTHVDAPWHFVEDGKPVDQMDLTRLVGPAYVAYLPETSMVSADDLDSLSLPSGVERLLLKTRNSKLWEMNVKEFREDFVAVRADAAEWIVRRGIRLVGIDYLSIAPYTDSMPTHQILLKAEVAVIEGLNLTGVEPGEYELLCLPMKLMGADGAPARAVLRTIN